MNKKEFIATLKQELVDIPAGERDDVLSDFTEHFDAAISKGDSEEAAAKHLGDPKKIAKEIKAEYLVEKAETNASAGNMMRAVYATIGLGFFNLVFVSGLFFGAVGLLFGLFAASLGMIFGGLSGIFAVFAAPFSGAITLGTSPIAAILISVGILSFGTMFFIINLIIARYFYIFMIRYLKFNLNIIRDKQ